MEYSKEFYLRSADFDMYERITPKTVLELFQDIAEKHAEEIGNGFYTLFSKNLLWVTARTKFVVEKNIAKYSTVKVKTWPLTPQRLIFRREYLIYNPDGEIAIRGSTDWMIINCVTRTIVPGADTFPENAKYCEELAINEKLRKIKEIDGEKTFYEVTPQYTDIDLNGHVNNTKYADFAINAIKPGNKPIKSFQADYHKEVLPGEKLKLTVVSNSEKTIVKGENTEGEKKFTCEIVFGE